MWVRSTMRRPFYSSEIAAALPQSLPRKRDENSERLAAVMSSASR
jgi:hypothetical protein